MNKRFLILIMVMLAGYFSIFSCAGKGFTNRTTVKCVFMASPNQVKMYNEIVSAFKKKYPQYKVVVSYYDAEYYNQKVNELFIGNEEPDLLQLDDNRTYARKGILQDLSKFILHDPDMAWNGFFPATRQLVEYQQGIYGFPVSLDTEVFYINKDKFKKAGIKVPYAGWTMAQFIKAARAMTKINVVDLTNAQYGFWIQPRFEALIPYIWSAGADIIDKDKNFTILDPKIKEVFQLFADLRLRDQYMAPLDLMTTTDLVELFSSGKIGMIASGRSFAPEIVAASRINWDVVPLPVIGDGSALVNGRICVIPIKARNKSGGWQFLRFMVLEEGAQIMLSAGDSIPPSMHLAYSSSFSNWGSMDIHNGVFLKQLECGRVNLLEQQQWSSNIIENIDEGIRSIFLGQTTVSSQLDMLESDIYSASSNVSLEN